MKLLVTGAWQDGKNHIQALENLGHQVVWMQNERDPIPCAYAEVEGVICNGLFLYHPIEKFQNLRYIQLTSAGFDRVPMDAIEDRNIRIRNARDVYSIPMAEFALWGVLQLYKQGRFFQTNQESHHWEKHRGLLELAGKTVCVVGCGSVGTECAKRFAAFGCRVLGIAQTSGCRPFFEKVYTLDALETLLTDVDILVLALPLNEKTKHLMDETRLNQMKQGAVLVNVSRGGVIHTESLVKVLDDRLGGAVLDVLEEEPLPACSPLWDMENVLVTPHNSFVGEGNNRRLRNLFFDNLRDEMEIK